MTSGEERNVVVTAEGVDALLLECVPWSRPRSKESPLVLLTATLMVMVLFQIISRNCKIRRMG